jgi:hypothetical protein
MAGACAALRGLLMADGKQTADFAPRERAVVREHALKLVLLMLEEEAREADWRREAASAILRLLPPGSSPPSSPRTGSRRRHRWRSFCGTGPGFSAGKRKQVVVR